MVLKIYVNDSYKQFICKIYVNNTILIYSLHTITEKFITNLKYKEMIFNYNQIIVVISNLSFAQTGLMKNGFLFGIF